MQLILVGVRREAGNPFDPRLELVLLAKDADGFGLLQNMAAERAEGLLPPDLLHIQIGTDDVTGTRTFRIFRENEA